MVQKMHKTPQPQQLRTSHNGLENIKAATEGIKVATMVQKNNNQPQWLRTITITHHGIENKQPQWRVKKEH